MGSLVYLVAIFGVFYFLMIRPEQKKKKKSIEMLSNLKLGDGIVTRGGLLGTIVELNDNIATIATGPNKVKINITRGAIGSITDSGLIEVPVEASEVKSEISLEKNNEENAE